MVFSAAGQGAGGYDAFCQHLEATAAALQLRKLKRVEDLELSADGSVAGYRFTTFALNQLCKKLSRGLASSLFDLGGLYMSRASVSPRLAIHMLNAVLRLRFRDTVLGCQLVCDSQARTIDGVVGASYRVIHNHDLVQRCNDTFLKTGRYLFHEAHLTGRRLCVRYRQPTPTLTLRTGRADPFYVGFSFSNSEVGSLALRGSTLILRGKTDTFAMAPNMQAVTVSHIIGKAAIRKFNSFLLRVQQRLPATEEALQNLPSLQSVNLGFTKPGEPYLARRKALMRLWPNTPASMLEPVLDMALTHGSYPEPAEPDEEKRFERYCTRTLFDLFNAFGKVARGWSIEGREKLEHAAYKLLLKNTRS